MSGWIQPVEWELRVSSDGEILHRKQEGRILDDSIQSLTMALIPDFSVTWINKFILIKPLFDFDSFQTQKFQVGFISLHLMVSLHIHIILWFFRDLHLSCSPFGIDFISWRQMFCTSLHKHRFYTSHLYLLYCMKPWLKFIKIHKKLNMPYSDTCICDWIEVIWGDERNWKILTWYLIISFRV